MYSFGRACAIAQVRDDASASQLRSTVGSSVGMCTLYSTGMLFLTQASTPGGGAASTKKKEKLKKSNGRWNDAKCLPACRPASLWGGQAQ